MKRDGLWIRSIKNLKMKKLQSKSILTLCIKKRPSAVIVGDSTVKHLHGKSIANKINSDNIILVKPFPGARTKAMKHVSPDLEKKPDLVILHIVTNDLKYVSSPEQIANEMISLALFLKENGQQIAVSGELFPDEIDSPKKLRVVTHNWKYSVKITM